jgi:hypothetical protein
VPYRLPATQYSDWYSGYDLLPCSRETIVALTPEELREIEERVARAEKEMARKLAEGLYR